MALDNLKITSYTDGVEELPDNPSDAGYTAAQLKAVFDARSNKEIKAQHNALVDEVAAHESGSNPHKITKAAVGLSKVDNTSDAEKPVSTAQREAIDAAKNEVLNEISVIEGPPGADGVSPTVTVTDISGGHRVKITDVNGTQHFDVMDGADGAGGGSGGSGTGNCANIGEGEGAGSLVQVISDSTSETVIYDMTDGGTSGWAVSGGTSTVIDTGITAEFAEANATFEMDVDFPVTAEDVVVYVYAIRYTNAAGAARTTLYINDVAVGDVNTTYIAGSTVTLITAGSAGVVAGKNKLKFVCNNYDGSAKYLTVSAVQIRGKQSIVTGESSLALGRYNVASGENSKVIGYNSTASAKQAIALGVKNTASGAYSITIGGYNSVAQGDYSATIGSGNQSLGTRAFTAGQNNTVSAVGGAALGNNNTVAGAAESGMAFGGNNTVSAVGGVALGKSNTITGSGGFAFGERNIAHQYSIAGGVDSQAAASRTIAIGGNCKALVYGSAAIGVNNTIQNKDSTNNGTGSFVGGMNNTVHSMCSMVYGRHLETPNADNLDGLAIFGKYNDSTNTKAIFQVGNGTNADNRSNAFEISTDNSGSLVYNFGSVSFTEEELAKLKQLLSTVDGNEVEY